MERMWLFHEDIELFHRAPLSLPRPHARARSRHLRFGHLGAPQRRSLGRSTTSVQHAADCSRESSVLKLAGPYMYMYYTCIPLLFYMYRYQNVSRVCRPV